MKPSPYNRLYTVSELEVICKSLKMGKAPGHDNIPVLVIKKSFSEISEPLLYIINLSLAKGVFPDKLKTAKVVPIYKANDSELFNNYRPISLLSHFSKFFERVMYNRLIEFVERFEILYSHQFGFRKNHSTSLALTHLINKIASAIDQNEVTVGIFLDLSKAFDTLDHEILFSKLKHYGIDGIALQWIKSYFCNRKQFVQINQASSSELTIKCGVPQGSILGPLFFILYINDLPNSVNISETLLFADDTSISCSHTDIDHLITVLNKELQSVDVWMKANKLSVNISKTKYVIFRPKQKRINTNIPILFDGKVLKQEQSLKFLGVHIDENLSWKTHINFLCQKISKSIGVIYRSRFYLSTKTKISLYYSLVYPYLSYCNIVWSSTYVTNLNRIFLLQKRAVRALTNAHYYSHTAPLFKQLRLLDIYNINSYYTARFMYSYHHQLHPPSFLNLFVTNSQVHNYNTRSQANYRSHPCRTNIKQFTILYQGPKLWNTLPTIVTNSESSPCFKSRMFTYLLSR